MTIERSVGDPETAYMGAPDLDIELPWLQGSTRTPGFESSREFLLRQAAFLDRLTLQQTQSHGSEVIGSLVRTAEMAAFGLVEHDTEHRGLSPKGADLAIGEDYRAYVREVYRAWSLAQNH
ncbi:hypothetical protein [Streptomyces uncialis]|uniref:hypothetical protein n=1 Tax=Streptomyces uncialis TaxID=1048205 RepID=UPI00386710B1|nr:hypothetical protein OG924_16375 [Streptomyces uncialis]